MSVKTKKAPARAAGKRAAVKSNGKVGWPPVRLLRTVRSAAGRHFKRGTQMTVLSYRNGAYELQDDSGRRVSGVRGELVVPV